MNQNRQEFEAIEAKKTELRKIAEDLHSKYKSTRLQGIKILVEVLRSGCMKQFQEIEKAQSASGG